MTSENRNNDISPALEFRSVSLSFDDKQALNNVSFKLPKGEMLLLTGESGSGKSVLLRLAIGLMKPDSGQIFIAGREIEDMDESELLAIRGGLMGMVFQEESLFSGLSVYENAAYRLEEHGWKESDIDKAVNEVLNYVGLESDAEKLPGQLSGGMKRRLEIARALIGWPAIMLFDEPTNSLDPIVAAQVLNLIMRARDINRISSIYVTKKTQEISYLAKFTARPSSDDGVTIDAADEESLSRTTIMVLDSGTVAFHGSAASFETSDIPSVKRLLSLEGHEHSTDPYFYDPWDRSRQPGEEIL
ncbi:MAG TPA: ATP-binding cassette domain-containing protein [Pyrinomonadaceae bacterium]|nr:ATP-binding cassette domain-containing protein [Pyrinomonadaceae bacterium]